MNSIWKKAGLGVALAATALTAVPAEAQWRGGGYRGGYHGGYHGGYRGYRGGNAAGAALLGGVIGLGVGAAIASNNRGYYRDGYYDRGYRGYYAEPQAYVAPPVYYDGYYRGPRCWTSYRWDPYYGQNVPVRVCN